MDKSNVLDFKSIQIEFSLNHNIFTMLVAVAIITNVILFL